MNFKSFRRIFSKLPSSFNYTGLILRITYLRELFLRKIKKESLVCSFNNTLLSAKDYGFTIRTITQDLHRTQNRELEESQQSRVTP